MVETEPLGGDGGVVGGSWFIAWWGHEAGGRARKVILVQVGGLWRRDTQERGDLKGVIILCSWSDR